MYLARLEIDPRKRKAREYLAKPQALHAALMRAAAPQADEKGRMLWRVDEFADRVFVIVFSPHRPDLTQLENEAGIPGTIHVANFGTLQKKLAAGQVWRFRLAANPTRSLSTTTDTRTGAPLAKRPQRGKVVAHTTAAHQRQWLLQKAEQLGITFLSHPGESDPVEAAEVRVVARTRLAFERYDPHLHRKKTVTINQAVFEGLIEVRDVDRFWRALTEGIGPAKAYGCGLMTVAPQ